MKTEKIIRIEERARIRKTLEETLYQMENHISGEDSLLYFASTIRLLLEENLKEYEC